MGKILESIGLIEGYDIISIGKGKAKKDILFEEIEKADTEIKKDVKKIVNNESGLVLAITKNKKIKGLYLFKAETNNDLRILNNTKIVYTDDVPKVIQEKYTNFVLTQVKEYVSSQQYDKVTIGDKVIQIDPKLTKKQRNIAISKGFILGFFIGWTVFDSFSFGILYGIIFAPVFSGLEVVITKKRGRKKKNK